MDNITPESTMSRYGAIDQVTGSYRRTIPSGIPQPAFDWLVANISRFESAEAAIAALPDVNADGLAALQEQWPQVELTEITLPTSPETASRQLLRGTVSQGNLHYDAAILVLQVNDIVGMLAGYSNWSSTDLEIAYLGDLVFSLASTGENSDLANLLPPEHLLVGGLRVTNE